MASDEERIAARAELLRAIEFMPDPERKKAYYAGRRRLIRADLWPFPYSTPPEVRLLRGFDREHGPVPPHAPELGPCWPWTGALTGDGYGCIQINGKAVYTHRAALEASLGRPLAIGMFACHKCENRACGRPSHLYEGTISDNNTDVWTVRKRPRPGSVFGDA